MNIFEGSATNHWATIRSPCNNGNKRQKTSATFSLHRSVSQCQNDFDFIHSMSSYSARRAERPLKIRRALSEDFSKLPSCSEDDVENVVEQSRISHFNAFDTGERYQLPVMGTGKSDSFQRISSETVKDSFKLSLLISSMAAMMALMINTTL